MKKMLLVILLAFVSQAAAQTPCSQTERASATSYGALAAPSGTPVSAVLQACENPGEAEEAEPSVYDDAIALWKLDETSDGSAPVTRVDSIGSLDLTDNNTVASAAKGVGAPANLPDNVASFVAANSEYLSYAGALVAADASVTVSAWVYAASDGTLSIVNDGNGDFLLRRSVGGNVDFFTRAFNDSVAESSPTITVGSWFHVVAIHDADTDTISISLNNNALATAATGGANGALTNWFVGSRSAALAFWDGYISSVAVWDRVLSDDERTALYNSGAGAPLP